MYILMYIILFSLLLLIFVQDMKFRAVTWIAFPILFLAALWHGLMLNNSLEQLWIDFSFNMMFLLIQYGVLTLYFSLKHRQLVNITKAYLGLGDVLFLICCTVIFSPINFILFYLSSTVVVILIHFISALITKVNPKIPLAGFQALMLMLVLISVQLIMKVNVYDDSWLSSYYI